MKNLEKLKEWFLEKKRDLPWRETRDPYAIWISEIMLQQTQVAVVIPYYLKWMTLFPSIAHLAEASLDQVIKAWEGLGYYSRARHLHEAAKTLVSQYQSQLPDREEELKKIKGLGPYTIGALLSFAFHQKKAAVDGNVIRVLTRYFGIKEDISKSATITYVREKAQELLPEEESWVINEALIELGATLCQRKARCSFCPLKASCSAFKEGLVEQLPYKSKKESVQNLYRSVAVIQCGRSYLVKRGIKGKIMSDLYEFPYFEEAIGEISPAQLVTKIAEKYTLKIIPFKVLQEERHSFTRYRVRLYPFLFKCLKEKKIEDYEWISFETLKDLPFSSGHRRIFNQIDKLYCR